MGVVPAIHEVLGTMMSKLTIRSTVDEIYDGIFASICTYATPRALPPSQSQRPTSWQRFLSTDEQALLSSLSSDMDFVFERFVEGTPGFTRNEIVSCRRLFNETIKELGVKADTRLSLSISKKFRTRGLCWAILKRLSCPSSELQISPISLVNHFQGVYHKLTEPLFFEDVYRPSYSEICSEDDPLNDMFSDNDLVNSLGKLNAGAATGPQGISSRSLKEVFVTPESRVPLLMLFNFCFHQGTVPVSWREGELFVLHKGGPKENCDNYRAICLLNDFRRVYEGLLDARFSSWITRTKAMGPMQFGFQKGASTLDAVLVLKSFVGYMTRVRRLPVFALFVDLRKAFPSVNRTKMLEIFKQLRVPCRIISAFAALLSGNSNKLRINFKLTDPFLVNVGVGEGSINSPRCFNVAYFSVLERLDIHPLPRDPNNYDPNVVYYIVFADDLTLFSCNFKKLEEAGNSLGPALAELNMSLNVKKTKWLPFLPLDGCSVRIRLSDWSMCINGEWIECVDRFKFLGFWLTSSLSNDLHESVICSKFRQAAHAWGAILRSMKITNFSSLRMYFNAFVQSQLYGSIFVNVKNDTIIEAMGIFVREVFSLPKSFPFAVSRVLLGLNDSSVSMFRQRVKYFRRIESDPMSSTFGALVVDRCFLLPHRVGVNSVFCDTLENAGLPRLSDYLEDSLLLKKLEIASLTDFRKRLFQSEAFLFWSHIEKDGKIDREFDLAISKLTFEQARLLIGFLGNTLRWSALNVPSEYCPLCKAKLYSLHFLECRHVAFSSQISTPKFYEFIQRKEYEELISFLFFVFRTWCDACPLIFRPKFVWDVDSFFDVMNDV